MKQKLKVRIPHKIKSFYKRIFPAPKEFGWFGDYADWQEAKQKCTGYDDAVILEKVKKAVMKVKSGEAAYERDSVLFDEIQYSEPLLNVFKHIAKENNNRLNVIDFGGSLGSSYFQNRNFLKEFDLKWSIVEQNHFVECGKEFIEDKTLKFYYSVEEALQREKPEVLFLSSVIQYFEKPFELIEKLLKYNIEYIIIDRTAFIKTKEDRITMQIVPEFIYKASYPAWFFNEEKFVNAFLEKYYPVNEFDSKFDPKEKLDDGKWTYRKGFVFKLKK